MAAVIKSASVSPTSAYSGDIVTATVTVDSTSWTSESIWINVYVKETGEGVIYWSGTLYLGLSTTKSGTFTMPSQSVTVVFEAYHYDGTDWIRDAYTERSVTLLKITPRMSIYGTPIPVREDLNCRIDARLWYVSPDYPYPVTNYSGKPIRFYVNGIYQATVTTDINGRATWIFYPAQVGVGPGIHTVKATFSGDAELNPVSASLSVTVEPKLLTGTNFANVAVDKTTVAVGDTVKLSGYLQDVYGTGLSGKPVDFYAVGKVGTITSGYNGYCEGRFTPTAALAGQSVGLFFQFLGDVDYASTTSVVKYVSVVEVVTATKLTIQADKTTVAVGEEITFTGRLTDLAGTGLALKEIDLYKDGVNVTAGLLQKNLTDWNGDYTIAYTPTPEDVGKTLQFYTRFAGDII